MARGSTVSSAPGLPRSIEAIPDMIAEVLEHGALCPKATVKAEKLLLLVAGSQADLTQINCRVDFPNSSRNVHLKSDDDEKQGYKPIAWVSEIQLCVRSMVFSSMACPSLLLGGSPAPLPARSRRTGPWGRPPALSGFEKSISEACRVLVHVLVLLSCGCRLTVLSSERHIVQRKRQKRLCYAGGRAGNSELR